MAYQAASAILPSAIVGSQGTDTEAYGASLRSYREEHAATAPFEREAHARLVERMRRPTSRDGIPRAGIRFMDRIEGRGRRHARVAPDHVGELLSEEHAADPFTPRTRGADATPHLRPTTLSGPADAPASSPRSPRRRRWSGRTTETRASYDILSNVDTCGSSRAARPNARRLANHTRYTYDITSPGRAMADAPSVDPQVRAGRVAEPAERFLDGRTAEHRAGSHRRPQDHDDMLDLSVAAPSPRRRAPPRYTAMHTHDFNILTGEPLAGTSPTRPQAQAVRALYKGATARPPADSYSPRLSSPRQERPSRRAHVADTRNAQDRLWGLLEDAPPQPSGDHLVGMRSYDARARNERYDARYQPAGGAPAYAPAYGQRSRHEAGMIDTRNNVTGYGRRAGAHLAPPSVGAGLIGGPHPPSHDRHASTAFEI